MRWLVLLCCGSWLLVFAGCQHAEMRADARAVPEPPPIAAREILRPSAALPGERIAFEAPSRFTLFLPEGWSVAEDGGVCLSIHFHGSTWFVIDEHIRRGAANPFVSFNRDGGPEAYRLAFTDPGVFEELLDAVEAALKERGAPRGTHVASLEVTAFGSGYGAAARLLQRGGTFSKIHTLLLLDPMDDEGMTPTLPNAGEAFVRYARAARMGGKRLVVTRSGWEGVDPGFLLASVGAGMPEGVMAGAIPASSTGAFPLVSRLDEGGLHVWLYGGKDESAHLTHLRHVADFWMALDGQ